MAGVGRGGAIPVMGAQGGDDTCYGCLADHCGGPREKMLYPGKIKDLILWTWKRNYVKCARHLPLYGWGF